MLSKFFLDILDTLDMKRSKVEIFVDFAIQY